MPISILDYSVIFSDDLEFIYKEPDNLFSNFELLSNELNKSSYSHINHVSPLDKPRIESFFKDLKNKPQDWNISYFLTDKNNINYHFIDHGTVCYNESKGRYEGAGFLINITSIVSYETDVFAKEINNAINKHSLVSITNYKGIIIYVNENFTALSKYEPVELIGKNHRIINSGHHDKTFWKHAWDTIKAGNIWNGEVCNRAKDGTLYWVDSIIHPIIDTDSNKITHFVSIRKDITKLKNTELELQYLKDQLEQTAKIARVGGWEIQPSLNNSIHYWSAVMKEIFEVEPDYQPNLSSIKQFIVDTKEQHTFENQMILLINDNMPFQYEYQIKTVNGNLKWLKIIGHKDNRTNRLFGTVQDITDQKSFEEKILRQHEFRKTLSDISTSFLKIEQENLIETLENSLRKIGNLFNVDSSFLFLTDENGKQFNQTIQWNVDTELSITQRIENAPIEHFSWTLNQLVNNELLFIADFQKLATSAHAEIQKIIPNDIDSVLFFRLKKGNNFFGIFGIGTRNSNEDWDKIFNSGISLIGNLFTDLLFKLSLERETIMAIEQAINANKAKSEFLANMSHEIRTPLNGVIGFSDLIVKNTDDITLKRYASYAQVSAQTLLELINNVLDYSKIEANKIELHYQPTPIIELLEQTINIIRGQIAEKGIELIANINPTIPPYISVDSIRLKQVVLNLLNNALKFTERGEIELQVDYSNLTSESVELTFAVRDSGIGIDKITQKKLFQPFIQADSSITKRYGGTGLGLSISQRLIKEMGSEITVESKVGTGSTFSFKLITPLSSNPEQTDEPTPAFYSVYKKALIIDSNPKSGKILHDYLIHLGLESLLVSKQTDFIHAFKHNPDIDVLIIESKLPDLNAKELLNEINDWCTTLKKSIPDAYKLSLSELNSFNTNWEKYGFKNQLIKPLTPSVIRDLVSGKLTGKKSTQINEQFISSTTAKTEPLNILLVDDTSLNLFLLTQMIQQIIPDAKITEANNAKEAIDMYAQLLPDYIFMDLQMPDIDGYTATEIIRKIEKEINHQSNIIAISADVIGDVKEKCAKAGMNSYISKPIKEEDFYFLKTR
ncbi:response regulator [bacterium]|nr:MAG: response regulator [bacterium]